MNYKKQLTFEEFIQLGKEEQSKRYVELNNEDKFKVRTSSNVQAEFIDKIDIDQYLSIERKKEIEEEINKINEHLNNCTYFETEIHKN